MYKTKNTIRTDIMQAEKYNNNSCISFVGVPIMGISISYIVGRANLITSVYFFDNETRFIIRIFLLWYIFFDVIIIIFTICD